jgi:addiction module HigA family antidote
MIHKHPHPGEILRETVIAPMNLPVTEAAKRLAMTRVALSRVLNGKAGISPDLALRLEKAGVSTADSGLTCRQITIFGAQCSMSSRR